MNGGSPVPKRKGEKKMYGTVGRKHVIKPNIRSGGRTVLLTQTKNRFNCHSLRFAGIISTSLTMSQHRRIKIVKDEEKNKNNNNSITSNWCCTVRAASDRVLYHSIILFPISPPYKSEYGGLIDDSITLHSTEYPPSPRFSFMQRSYIKYWSERRSPLVSEKWLKTDWIWFPT